jgi:mRNA-degrading endonuclease RelE of RelBE toxin-antitoxin system
MFDPANYPITIAEMPSATKDLDDTLSETEKERLIDWLALHPQAGDIIVGTNGVRKTRWAYGAKGKSGGLRVIYYFRDLNMPIYIVAVYRKNEKLTISMREKQMISRLIDDLVKYWADRRGKLGSR